MSPNSPEESRGLLTTGHGRDTAVNHRSRQVGGVVTKEKQGGRLLLKAGDQAGARGREGKWEEPASLRKGSWLELTGPSKSDCPVPQTPRLLLRPLEASESW